MVFSQSRTVCCVFYSLNDVYKFIDQFGFADYEYSYIYHDKDKNKDGTQKEPHYHFFGHRKSPITQQSLQNFAKKCEQNIFYENLKSNDGALLRYFTHADNDDKAKYEIKDIVANFDIDARLRKNNSGVAVDPAIIIAMYDQGFNTIDIIRKFPKLIYSVANLQRYERLHHAEKRAQLLDNDPKVKHFEQVKFIPLFPVDGNDLPF